MLRFSYKYTDEKENIRRIIKYTILIQIYKIYSTVIELKYIILCI